MAEEAIVKVYFLDNSSKQFTVTEATTVGDVCNEMVGKLAFKDETVGANFTVFQSKDGVVGNTPLDSKASILEAQQSAAKLIYMLKLLTPAVASGYESDPMLTHLLFVQSLHSVITGTHFYKDEAKCLKLAAMDAFIKYGKSNPEVHKEGFLADRVAEMIPGNMFGNKTPAEWEAAILAGHAELDQEGDVVAMKAEYVKTCAEWQCNGCFFIEVKQTCLKEGTPELVLIGINIDGLHILGAESRESVAYFPLSKIERWNYNEKESFYIRVSGADIEKHEFTTTKGDVLSGFMKDYSTALAEKMMAEKAAEEAAGEGADEGKK